MKVKIDKKIADLYSRNSLSCEVSLVWVLGYIYKDYGKQVPKELFDGQITEYILQDIDDSIIEQIGEKFDMQIGVDAIVNFLCTVAFILGGEE